MTRQKAPPPKPTRFVRSFWGEGKPVRRMLLESTDTPGSLIFQRARQACAAEQAAQARVAEALALLNVLQPDLMGAQAGQDQQAAAKPLHAALQRIRDYGPLPRNLADVQDLLEEACEQGGIFQDLRDGLIADVDAWAASYAKTQRDRAKAGRVNQEQGLRTCMQVLLVREALMQDGTRAGVVKITASWHLYFDTLPPSEDTIKAYLYGG
jgi:hypothetical protein